MSYNLDDLATKIDANEAADNTYWLLWGGALVFSMQFCSFVYLRSVLFVLRIQKHFSQGKYNGHLPKITVTNLHHGKK